MLSSDYEDLFSTLNTARKRSRYGKARIHLLSLDDLIAAKRRASRPKDRMDLNKLLRRKKAGP